MIGVAASSVLSWSRASSGGEGYLQMLGRLIPLKPHDLARRGKMINRDPGLVVSEKLFTGGRHFKGPPGESSTMTVDHRDTGALA